jgi:hypothetical protein
MRYTIEPEVGDRRFTARRASADEVAVLER